LSNPDDEVWQLYEPAVPKSDEVLLDWSNVMSAARKDEYRYERVFFRSRLDESKRLGVHHAYTCDSDLDLITSSPFGFIIARLEFKMMHEPLRFSQVISFNHLISIPAPWTIPVFIVRCIAPPEFYEENKAEHRFRIEQYKGCSDWRKDEFSYDNEVICESVDWNGYFDWEVSLREWRCREFEEYWDSYKQRLYDRYRHWEKNLGFMQGDTHLRNRSEM